MLAFGSVQTLAQAASTPAFATGLAGLSATSCTAMRCLHSPIAGEASAAPLRARFSYVVRYHRPADDEAAFVRQYLNDHPPLIGRLPGVRNVVTYVPLPWRLAGGPPPADYLLGNEATFDDAGAFNAAMASPVRHELRAHYRTLPRFTGRNTHFADESARVFRVERVFKACGAHSGDLTPEPGRFAETPVDVDQRAGHFAHRGVGFDRLHYRRHDVAAGIGVGAQRVQRALDRAVVALGLDAAQRFDLRDRPHFVVGVQFDVRVSPRRFRCSN